MEQVLICALNTQESPITERDIEELSELIKTAGGQAVSAIIQNRSTPEPKTLIGTGKALEVKEQAESLDATLVVFDNELTPAQTKNLEEIVGVRVIDRSTLILDIFASRAHTSEGKLQVELAQYKYILPRLTGKGVELSRLGGGIGTRGPGESKLETDRRHIRSHISRLKEALERVRRVRSTQRMQRMKSEIKTVAIVGYTNAGKSTLLNLLTESDIPANNRLFDTLDPTSRTWQVDDTLQVILSDTVGFIRKLPHHLVDAFRATLEELVYADLILHVIDASDPDYLAHAQVVCELIDELGAADKPCVTVFNKTDLLEDKTSLIRDKQAVCISARTGDGTDTLSQAVIHALNMDKVRLTLLIPYSSGGVLDLLHRSAQVISEDYRENGVLICAICDRRVAGQVQDYISEGE